MSKIVFDISMSLDGFITAGNQSQEEPLGEGGQQLHAWIDDDSGRQILEEASGDLGAVIAGRKTYDDSIPWWGLPKRQIPRPTVPRHQGLHE